MLGEFQYLDLKSSIVKASCAVKSELQAANSDIVDLTPTPFTARDIGNRGRRLVNLHPD